MTARLTALPGCRIFLLIAALLLAAGAAPAAAADSWRVHGKSEGLLHRLSDSSDWQPSSSGLELPPGTSLQAGDGTAVLGQADNRIIMLSGSEFTLPAPETEIVFQRHGRIRYQIRPGSTRNFRVESPYLAIGIKGTRFDVLVSSAGAEVRVLEGRVVASTPDGSYSVELTPGQVARIGAAPGSVLEVQQVSGQSSGQAFAPAPQDYPNAPAVRADAGDLVSPTMTAGYQGEPSTTVSEAAAAVTSTTVGVLDRLGAGVRDFLSNVEVVADDRLRSAPRTVAKGVRGLSRRAYGNVASRDSGGGSGGDASGGGDSSASSSGSGGSSGDSSGGGSSGGGSSSGDSSSGDSSSGGSSGGSGSGGSSSGGGLGGAVGGLGGAVGGAVGGVTGGLGL